MIFLLIFVFWLFAPSSVIAAEGSLFVLQDPIGDDHGPGYYVYPANAAYSPGSFDVTSFEVRSRGGIVSFKIKFKNKIVCPPKAKTASGKELSSLVRTPLCLMNIDIYLDKDHISGSGESSALPGRGAGLDRQSFWEQAVLITPSPDMAREELKNIAPELLGKVLIPDDYIVLGDTVIAEIPTQELGEPKPWWGYLVIITPADLDPAAKNISLIKVSAREKHNLALRPVLAIHDEWSFGGADPSGISSNIIDIIVPSGESQEKVLSSYNAITLKRVVLTAAYPLEWSSPTKEAAHLKGKWGLEATVLSLGYKTLTIDKGERDGIYLGRIGKIIDDYGDIVTDVVVIEVYDTHSVCRVMKVAVISNIFERAKVYF